VVAIFALTGSLAGLVVIGFSRVFEVGLLAWILGGLTFLLLNDLFLAWENERAIEKGKIRLWNEMVGETVVASETFTPEAGRYRGTVKLGMESWVAISKTPLSQGEEVRITARKDLVLNVEPSA